MTVINPNSISGITSITLPSGGDNVLTIHTNDGTERFRIDSSGNVKVGSACTISQDGDVFFTGVCTATTLAGSGANLTALPAANLTGALPAISGANLTGIAATDNVRTGILDVAGIATFRSDVNIPNINGGQIGGRRNIVINGAMRVAQRGTSDSGITASEYADGPDRYKLGGSSFGTVTVSQSTDSPDGFSNSYKVDVTTANASLSAGSLLEIQTSFEGQDVQHFAKGSSAAKEYTLSFYVKTTKTGTYVAMLQDHDNTRLVSKTYTVSDTNWNRYTITYPADTTGAFGNDNAKSLSIKFVLVAGTNFTSGSLQTTWGSSSDSISRGGQVNFADNTSNDWYLTGVQLEVGSQATAFEHRSFGEELRLCQRYFQKFSGGVSDQYMFAGKGNGSNSCDVGIPLAVPLRASPTLTCAAHRFFSTSTGTYTGSTTAPTVIGFDTTIHSTMLAINASGVTSSNNAVGNWCPYAEPLSIDSEL